MPRRDGSGPMGAGSMTGRGLGICTGVNSVRYGAGRRGNSGRGLGFRHGFAYIENLAQPDKAFLQAQKETLKNRLKVIDKQLENL